jgi:hypothetical protein
LSGQENQKSPGALLDQQARRSRSIEPGHTRPRAAVYFELFIMGSGYRSTVEALSSINKEKVRLSTIEGVRQDRIQEVRTDVIYAIGRKRKG